MPLNCIFSPCELCDWVCLLQVIYVPKVKVSVSCNSSTSESMSDEHTQANGTCGVVFCERELVWQRHPHGMLGMSLCHLLQPGGRERTGISMDFSIVARQERGLLERLLATPFSKLPRDVHYFFSFIYFIQLYVIVQLFSAALCHHHQ